MNKDNRGSAKKKIDYATILLVVYDVVAVNLAYFLALWIRFDCRFSWLVGSSYTHSFVKFIPINSVFCIAEISAPVSVFPAPDRT